VRPYERPSDPWQSVGTTPVVDLRLPRGAYRWRFSRAGSDTVERAGTALPLTMRVQLPESGLVPDGMVSVGKSTDMLLISGLGLPQEMTLEDYVIQRHEVSNRDYKKFVDAGGYRRREFWKHDFVDAGTPLTWDEAMARFLDKAGQPGPATWEVGAYPPGQDDLPVGGVSWYEAAAYAEFAGLSLPTLHHWYRAADITAGPFLLPLANFDYRGPRAVGTSGAMSPSGAVDMAGNVREWVWNGTNGGLRYILGGAWGEPQYMFGQLEAISPFDRSPQNGFRCGSFRADGPPDGRAAATFDRVFRDFRSEQPVGDETFAQYVRMFAYAPAPLDARVEKTLDAVSDVRVERVTFMAAYEGERVIAYLWLPKTATPPFQTLVLFPGGEAIRPAGPEVLEQPDRYDFLVRSGRAIVHPVYSGMYERFGSRPTDPIAFRNQAIRWAQDLRRTVDYLETRPDINRDKLGYFGSSLGAGFSPIPLVLEPRLSLAILIGGGLANFRWEPEVYSLNYLPRVKVPVLLMGGRHDYFLPLESSQKPFFERLGTPEEHKKHVVVEAAHGIPRHEYVREMLAWLDKYFGPAR
jgi:formylglycine-generating enzyme required for sulfatase activity